MIKHLCFAISFISISAMAQPGYPEPCQNDNYPVYKDLNYDGEPDVQLYMSSEGTDDVPSSSGMCFYGFQFMNPNMGLLVEQDWNTLSGTTSYLHRDSAKYIEFRQSRVQPLLARPYGRDASREWRAYVEMKEYYAFYQIEDGDTLLGWFEIRLDTATGNVAFGESVRMGSGNGVIVPGSYQFNGESIFRIGWKHNAQVGIGAVDRGPVSARTAKGAFYAGYYAQYGLMIEDVHMIGFESSINAEFYNWNASNNINVRWSSFLHIVIIDFGFAFNRQFPLNSELETITSFQWETGLSLMNYRLMFGFNARPLTDGVSPAAIPKYSLRFNYQF
ncbi:hypothetical protein [Phaeocystidibacter luteus]|uniref:Uncharacterized protein n=1 Tax=Phaeocystidibacter luteus TaxID=911197 RepID=A0A6N6RHZ6_9FLAO|nr:hypothetical protein [Phaeocystidibacter luteus]KAB2809907.1 hypothetical protein F8C67_08480 [Phaeocystidibacter luteus]